MMNYKDIIGYNKSKKSGVKKTPKPELKINKVLESVKNDLGYREPIKEVGAAAEYKPYIKKIEKAENLQAKEVNKLVKLLQKKGLKKEATRLASHYMINMRDFTNFLKYLSDELL